MTQIYRRLSATSLLIATFAAGPALGQTTDHSGHSMSGMGHSTMSHGVEPDDRSAHMVEARGTLVSLNTDTREATIRHDAMPAVSWPPAQMIFPVGDKVNLSALTIGQSVQFTLHRAADGSLPLVELCSAQGNGVTPGLCASPMDYSTMNHGQMDHSKMDHSAMPHGAMSHGDSHTSGTDAATPSSAHRHDANE